MKRYLEFVGGSSAKFYEVSTSGNQVTIRFGRIGTEGQTQVKTLADADAATQHADRLIASKLAKGYRETVAC
jgi:predicted DNA-binding WGR domain protein